MLIKENYDNIKTKLYDLYKDNDFDTFTLLNVFIDEIQEEFENISSQERYLLTKQMNEIIFDELSFRKD